MLLIYVIILILFVLNMFVYYVEVYVNILFASVMKISLTDYKAGRLEGGHGGEVLSGCKSGYKVNEDYYWRGHVFTGAVYGTRHFQMAFSELTGFELCLSRLAHIVIGIIEYIPIVGSLCAAGEAFLVPRVSKMWARLPGVSSVNACAKRILGVKNSDERSESLSAFENHGIDSFKIESGGLLGKVSSEQFLSSLGFSMSKEAFPSSDNARGEGKSEYKRILNNEKIIITDSENDSFSFYLELDDDWNKLCIVNVKSKIITVTEEGVKLYNERAATTIFR